ncbi:MAG: 16S rRNA (cytosine1402-N4)-methyltransferase [bacterium]|jgi:16S rRNA (cytosine1402-N4)-methyltransferase
MLSNLKPTVHVSVLLNEVVENAGSIKGKTFVDGTFGGGGYARALLDAGAALVIGIDQDPLAIKRAETMQQEFGDRLVLVNGCFSELKKITKELGKNEIDGIVLDLGFSSDQLDDYERGFAFKYDGPLDMRMSSSGETAADVLANYEEEALANIFYKYGEERKSRPIAKLIVERRQEKPLKKTQELVDLVQEVIPSWHGQKKNPAMKVFQALRIHVNHELEELERVLPDASDILNIGGRLCVVTFHSLEDRLVKNYFRDVGKPVAKNKYSSSTGEKSFERAQLPEPAGEQKNNKKYTMVNRKPILPTALEVTENSRARSAKLRVLERIV